MAECRPVTEIHAQAQHQAAPGNDCFRVASGTKGIERLEASLHGQPFSPHRHDTYAIGITVSGVQTFRYRGERWQCLPGQCHILHPDELHDGGAGTEEGFCYRMLYIDPALIQEALQGRPLPFVKQAIVDADLLRANTSPDLWDLDTDLDDVVSTDLIVAASNLLLHAAEQRPERIGSLNLPALLRVKALISANCAEQHSMDELEVIAGIDRWTLARQFRAAFGTSPRRYRTLRQLDRVRLLLKQGLTLADAAMDAGFSDQSHMTRQFKLAYGLTPKKWLTALNG
ncbi:AraC family transcriptional regulator [Mangrovitalea sediminis]|uniref:AraC family transcriptional regulator n=1 Tax=Mangrovitalea sediminis TaxID=1982043 RepID=UPI000BE5E7A4|nr:AraC family transcriptional regulator [Mangrovitalea sediminis]